MAAQQFAGVQQACGTQQTIGTQQGVGTQQLDGTHAALSPGSEVVGGMILLLFIRVLYG